MHRANTCLLVLLVAIAQSCRTVQREAAPAHAPTQAPASTQPTEDTLAIVLGEPILRSEIESGPEKYRDEHAYRFYDRVVRPLLVRFKDQHPIEEPTEAEVTELVIVLRSAGDTEKEDVASRPFCREMVQNWKFSRALYRKYGGAVIWNQFNPTDPVGAVAALYDEAERDGDVRLIDPVYAIRFRDALHRRQTSWEIPPERLDMETPWWRRPKDSNAR